MYSTEKELVIHNFNAAAKKRSYVRKFNIFPIHKDKSTLSSTEKRRHFNPWSTCLSSAKGRAKKSGLPYNLTEGWAKSRYTGFCELTGIPFIYNGKLNIHSCTIDKIKPELGYVQSNCRFIVHCINCFKLDGSDEAMYAAAEALLSRRLAREFNRKI